MNALPEHQVSFDHEQENADEPTFPSNPLLDMHLPKFTKQQCEQTIERTMTSTVMKHYHAEDLHQPSALSTMPILYAFVSL